MRFEIGNNFVWVKIRQFEQKCSDQSNSVQNKIYTIQTKLSAMNFISYFFNIRIKIENCFIMYFSYVRYFFICRYISNMDFSYSFDKTSIIFAFKQKMYLLLREETKYMKVIGCKKYKF